MTTDIENPEKIKTKLQINENDKLLMGVCSSFGKFLSVNPVLIRLVVILLFLLLGKSILILYTAFGVLLPINETPDVQSSQENKNLKNSLLMIIVIIHLVIILIIIKFYTIYEIGDFILNRVNSITFLLFSIALIINNRKVKREIEVKNINNKKLYRSERKIIYGICSGLGEYFGVNPTIIRFLWIIFLISSFGTAALVYFALRFVIPTKTNSELYS